MDMNPISRLAKVVLPPGWPPADLRSPGVQKPAAAAVAFEPPAVVQSNSAPPEALSAWAPDSALAGQEVFGSSQEEVAGQARVEPERKALPDAESPVVVHAAMPPDPKQLAKDILALMPGPKTAQRAQPTPFMQDMTKILTCTSLAKQKTHFVQFVDGHVQIVEGRGRGLDSADQQHQLRQIINTELRTYHDPDGDTKKLIDRYCKELVPKLRADSGDHFSVEAFMPVFKNIRAFKDKTDYACHLEQELRMMQREQTAYQAADPDRKDGAGIPGGRGIPSVDGILLHRSNMISGLFILHGVIARDETPGEARKAAPFGPAHLDRVLNSVAFNRQVLHRGPVAVMFNAIARDDALSDQVLEHVNSLYKLCKDAPLKHKNALGQAAALLVLSLPRSRLEQMVVTRSQVSRMFVELRSAVELELGTTLNIHGSAAILGKAAVPFFRGITGEMEDLGHLFAATPQGAAMSRQFGDALKILMHNAERLEELAALEDLGDTDVWKGQPLISLLNEYVPPNFGPRLEFSGDEKQAPLALTLTPDDTQVAPTPQATPQAVDAVPAALPDSDSTAAHERPTTLRPRRKNVEPAAGRRPEPAQAAPDQAKGYGIKQPGSKKTYSLGHTHKREWDGLSGPDRDLRMAKARLYDAGSIGRWTECTPELLEMVREQKHAARQARAGDVPLHQGQNLIRQPSIETKY